MNGREARLAELGLKLPEVAAPVAAYAPAVRTGNLVFVSGQLPFVDGRLLLTGKVAAEVTPEQAHGLAQRCVLNALAAAAELAGGLEAITQIVKLVGYVACTPEFTGHPAVIDGASELLRTVFGDSGAHARAAVGVASLPLDSPVEVELIVEIAWDGAIV